MKVIAYARASTEDQEVTLQDQQNKLRDYARLYEHQIVEMVVGAESAKTIEKRDGFQRALQLLRDGQADGLLVLKLDRLARDVADGQHLLRTYFGEDSKFKCHLFSVQDYIDTRTATGRMLFSMQLVIAQWERETISERTKAALTHLRKTGMRVGAIRYGYDLDPLNPKALIPNDDEQEVIRLMQKRRQEGLSYQAIADELNAHSVPTKANGKWASSTVYRILRNSE